MAQIVKLLLRWFDWRDALRYIAAETPQEVYRDRYLKSFRWLVIRTARRCIAFGVCQKCFARWGSQAHHDSYRHRGKPGIKSLILEALDTRWLCDGCHREEHGRK